MVGAVPVSLDMYPGIPSEIHPEILLDISSQIHNFTQVLHKTSKTGENFQGFLAKISKAVPGDTSEGFKNFF